MSIEVHLQAVSDEVAGRIAHDRIFTVEYFGLDLKSALEMAEGQWNPPNRGGDYLFIGLDWQAIHFIISGGEVCFAGQSKVPGPIARAIMNADEIGELNTGYGKIRINRQAEVKKIAVSLEIFKSKVVSDAELLKMNAMRVYPPNQCRNEEDARRIESAIGLLRDFYSKAASSNMNAIIWAD